MYNIFPLYVLNLKQQNVMLRTVNNKSIKPSILRGMVYRLPRYRAGLTCLFPDSAGRVTSFLVAVSLRLHALFMVLFEVWHPILRQCHLSKGFRIVPRTSIKAIAPVWRHLPNHENYNKDDTYKHHWDDFETDKLPRIWVTGEILPARA